MVGDLRQHCEIRAGHSCFRLGVSRSRLHTLGHGESAEVWGLVFSSLSIHGRGVQDAMIQLQDAIVHCQSGLAVEGHVAWSDVAIGLVSLAFPLRVPALFPPQR